MGRNGGSQVDMLSKGHTAFFVVNSEEIWLLNNTKIKQNLQAKKNNPHKHVPKGKVRDENGCMPSAGGGLNIFASPTTVIGEEKSKYNRYCMTTKQPVREIEPINQFFTPK